MIQSNMHAIVPIPQVPISVRVATLDDLPFMDALHKRHGKALGFFPTEQFQEYIEMGAVLVADDAAGPVGYIIWRDRYLKRDELGVIYQLCVVPGSQRKLVGASLVRAAFERSAYGCRLYCLWCAKDLDANYFWESLGFVPVAFRAGSDKKRKGGRVHIFWQKRIVEGDVETKWWYPAQTTGGAIRADRLVFPIPPGTRWQDVEAVNLPGSPPDVARASRPRLLEGKKAAGGTPAPRGWKAPVKVGPLCGGFMFAPPTPPKPAAPEAEKTPKQGARERKPKAKIDPKYAKAARELRDRWLEQVNAGAYAFEDAGKYDVSRALPDQSAIRNSQSAIPLLPAA